jgi:hypothetical protein
MDYPKVLRVKGKKQLRAAVAVDCAAVESKGGEVADRLLEITQTPAIEED